MFSFIPGDVRGETQFDIPFPRDLTTNAPSLFFLFALQRITSILLEIPKELNIPAYPI